MTTTAKVSLDSDYITYRGDNMEFIMGIITGLSIGAVIGIIVLLLIAYALNDK